MPLAHRLLGGLQSLGVPSLNRDRIDAGPKARFIGSGSAVTALGVGVRADRTRPPRVVFLYAACRQGAFGSKGTGAVGCIVPEGRNRRPMSTRCFREMPSAESRLASRVGAGCFGAVFGLLLHPRLHGGRSDGKPRGAIPPRRGQQPPCCIVAPKPKQLERPRDDDHSTAEAGFSMAKQALMVDRTCSWISFDNIDLKYLIFRRNNGASVGGASTPTVPASS